MRQRLVPTAVLALLLPALVTAADWPQWLGPARDSVWREIGIVKSIPEDGLPVRWRAPVQLGYGGPAVAGGKVVVMDYVVESGDVANSPRDRDELTGKERVLCLDATSGRELWQHTYARTYNFSFGGGPRCTPTIDDGKVYALGAEGNLTCLTLKDGRLRWSTDFARDYGAKPPTWGHSAHPLVDGNTLYCVVGGEGSVVVAFDKNTGKEKWRALTAVEQGYCPPTMIHHAGVKQLLIWHAESLNSLDPATGEVHWSVPMKPRAGMAIAAPRLHGDYLFASAFGKVGTMLKLDPVKPAAREVWGSGPKRGVYSANVTPFIEDGVIYGCDIGTGALMAVDINDGKRLWQTLAPTLGGDKETVYGTAFLVKHENRFFLFNEKGDLILARLSPKGYEEQGRFNVLAPSQNVFGRQIVWSHPAFAQRCVFARNDKELVCVDLSAK